uniref:ORF 36 n=1 Tax=Human herpesvirus 3 TaxID=10335 RepID=W6E966_HHV3|nr:ORF 36 [Human alphaherpesvirus 3]
MSTDKTDVKMGVLRIYLDGAYGIGKTTAAEEFLHHFAITPNRILLIGEPLSYWRNLAGEDAICGIYGTQTRRLNGDVSPEDAQRLTAHFQSLFCSPHAIMHAKISALMDTSTSDLVHVNKEPYKIMLSDRHPIASTICFPLSRYLVGDMSPAALPGLLFTLPAEPPGTNLVVCTVSLPSHLSRVSKRARPGETVNLPFVMVLRNVYIMLINTIIFLKTNNWHAGWNTLSFCNDVFKQKLQKSECIKLREVPGIEDTLFAVLKLPELCGEFGNILPLWAWGMETLSNCLRSMSPFVLSLEQTPQHAAQELKTLLPQMTPANMSSGAWNILKELVNAVQDNTS